METLDINTKFEILKEANKFVIASLNSNNEKVITLKDVFNDMVELLIPTEVIEEPKQEPAVPIKKSIKGEYIICLEDGKQFKSLTRHLKTHYNLTPEEYRQKWNLPYDYPMVAPEYAEKRREIAKAVGLGRKPKKAAKPVTEVKEIAE